MRRSAVARLTLTVLACLAVSMDSATKVLHGFLHQRETFAHELHAAAHRSADAATVDADHAAIDAPDDADDHGGLHQGAAPNMLSKAQPAIGAAPQVPMLGLVREGAVLEFAMTRAASFSVRAGPDQPR